MNDPVVIVGSARTAIGAFQGTLKALTATALGAAAIKAAIDRSALPPHQVQEVIMGNVLSAGLGQAPARQASLGAGLPLSAGCTSINKMCGSGMKAVMFAHDLLLAGNGPAIVAGGMESMSNAPHLLPKSRAGLRLGHGEIKDHMLLDGLEDAYDRGRLMGAFAEDAAASYQFTREAQDRYAMTSLRRAQNAIRNGWFSDEIAAVDAGSGATLQRVEQDEQPLKARPEKIPQLQPVFKKDGTVTAANSSSISDGAAALVLMRLSDAQRHNIKPLARIIGHATHAQEPGLFSTAPVTAIRKLLASSGWQAAEVDLFEINEAFAVVAMAAMQDLGLPHEKVNIHGGACALGHPIGASGARIVVTLLAALQRYQLKRGVASLCIGGGEATALAVERMS